MIPSHRADASDDGSHRIEGHDAKEPMNTENQQIANKIDAAAKLVDAARAQLESWQEAHRRGLGAAAAALGGAKGLQEGGGKATAQEAAHATGDAPRGEGVPRATDPKQPMP